MTDSNSGKKPISKNAGKTAKVDGEMNEKQLEQVSGGMFLAKPANPRRKKPNRVGSDDGPWP